MSHAIETEFISFLTAEDYSGALVILEQHPALLESKSPVISSGISLLLLISHSFDECISFCEEKIRSAPSSDLFYNLAYAYELQNRVLEAIRYYQCARLYTMDTDLRTQIQIKLLQLRNPTASEETLTHLLTFYKQQGLFILEQLKNPHMDLSPSDFITVSPPESNASPRILFGTLEIANHIAHYLRCFRSKGMDVFAVNYHPSYLNYDCDFRFNLSTLSPTDTLNHYAMNAIDLICEYDVFHFLFNRTLMPQSIDIAVLKKLGKRVFMHNLGSEIRVPEIARSHHPYWQYAESYLAQLKGAQIQKNILDFSQWIDHCIVNDYEMRSYVSGAYKHVHMVGLPIDLEKYPFIGIRQNGPIRIVHAPTNRSVKGSVFFEAAIEKLKVHYDIDYHRIEHTSHEEAIKQYASADIVLDELIIGTYGSLTVECMAMGKCVVTFIHPGFPPPHGVEIPVWSVTIDTLEQRLDMLLSSYELRQQLSQAGRRYVENYNDVNQICSTLLNIYTNTGESTAEGDPHGSHDSIERLHALLNLEVPPSPTTHKLKLQANVLFKSGCFDEALKLLNSHLEFYKDNLTVLLLLGELCFLKHQTAGIFNYINQFYKELPAAHSFISSLYGQHLTLLTHSPAIDYSDFSSIFADDLKFAYSEGLISKDQLAEIVNKMPPHALILESYRGCNLKCPLCPLQGHLDICKVKQAIALPLVVSLFNDACIHSGISRIFLHNIGESLLNPDFYTIVRLIKTANRNIKVSLDSNLSLNIDPDELVQCGLDELIVAFDGYDQESYEKYRVNGRLETVIQNMRSISEAKRRNNHNLPIVYAKCIVFKHLEEHLEDIQAKAYDAHADSFLTQRPIVFNPENPHYVHVNSDDWISTSSIYSRYLPYNETSGKLITKKHASKGCPGILTYLAASINYDGNVYPCCFLATEETLCFGNLRDKSFSEIWFSPEYVQFRIETFFDKTAYPCCQYCDSE